MPLDNSQAGVTFPCPPKRANDAGMISSRILSTSPSLASSDGSQGNSSQMDTP
jgi:hypothetical protein